MAIDYAKLKAWPFADIEHHYTPKDVMLYALGLGIGADPVDRAQLRFVYEDGLCVLPTFAQQLGYPGFWVADPGTGVDWKQVLNGEQGVEIFRPLPPSGHVIARHKVEEVIDKGPGNAAMIYTRRDVTDAQSGQLLCCVTQTIVCRGAGGFGGPVTQTPKPASLIPDTPPTLTFDLKTPPQAALIFRLSGDYNPLHADPDIATGAGFVRPILHGAALLGIAGYALVRLLCDERPSGIQSMNVRFASPVYPGETIRTEAWTLGSGQAAFRARVLERDLIVLNGGHARYES